MLEMKRFSQLRTSLNFSKENTILRELKGEKMYTDSKTISSFFLSFFLLYQVHTSLANASRCA